jgi:hypothetical protein
MLLLKELMKNSATSAQSRSFICEIAGLLPSSTTALDILAIGIKDANPFVRADAAYNLGHICGDRSKSILEQAKLLEKDPTISRIISESLELISQSSLA